MYISIFSDEFYKDVYQVLPIIKEWGMKYVDLRGMINGKPIEEQTEEELIRLKSTLDEYGLKVGVIQSSLCKVHLPDEAGQKKELKKLEGIIRACNILGTRLVRSFFYWQHNQNDPACGELAMRPDALSKVLSMFAPVAKRAKEAGLVLSFENCGTTPDEVICVLEALNEPEWGMAWDVSNMFELLPEAKGDCVEYFTKALKYANSIHVKARGVPAIGELNSKKVPWERVLAGVAVTGKDMPISIETHTPAASGLDRESTCKRVFDYISGALPASAPGDMKTALAPKITFNRPYSQDPVRMVVVGLGMGKTRWAQIKNTCGIQLYGVCDINEEKARQVGELYGVPYSTDINTFLKDPKVEAMYVVTPTGTHCDIAMECFKAGKHVLTTKPMDVNYKKCDKAIAMAREKGLLFGVDFDLHFRGPLTELARAVDSGFFGQSVKGANITLNIRRDQKYYDENGKWRGTWSMDGGGALSNQGIHEIDRLITILGFPDEVRATTEKQTFNIEAEDYGTTLWRYKNGSMAQFTVTTSYVASSWYCRVEVYGERGAYLNVSGGGEGDRICWYKDGKWSETSPIAYKREWQQGSDNFAYCLRTGAPLLVDAKRGRNARYILDKMYESSAAGGKWIKIEKDELL